MRAFTRVYSAVLCAAALTSAAAQTSAAPLPAYRSRVLGVFSQQTGEPIEGVTVLDMLSRTSALTTKTGTVSLSFLPDGGSLVRLQKIGYAATTLTVAISLADTVPITVVMEPVSTLPTVVTTDSAPVYHSPGLRVFEAHRKNGMGHFLTPAELRKADNRSMSNVIRTLGVNVQCSRTGRYTCFAVSARQGSRFAFRGGTCFFDIYLDGMVLTDKDLESIPVNTIAAVEAYSGAATIPAEYNATGSACGVLLFWSRDR